MSSRIVIDRGGRLRRHLGLEDDAWGLFVADRWGVLYHVARAPDPAELPTVDEVREWARFLATQCPECGVIDHPVTGGSNPP